MYKRTFWQDHVEGVQEGTDMSAANFNKLEAGTMEANALAAFNAEHQRYANDVAKNSEIVVLEHVFENYIVGNNYDIAIPAHATRNNINYNVVPVIDGSASGDPVLLLINSQQANGFTVSLRGDGDYTSVRFLISGGMI